jgi:hypothetical protein
VLFAAALQLFKFFRGQHHDRLFALPRNPLRTFGPGLSEDFTEPGFCGL